MYSTFQPICKYEIHNNELRASVLYQVEVKLTFDKKFSIGFQMLLVASGYLHFPVIS